MIKEQPKGKRENIIANIPLGRMGEPEDIAEAVVFLVSDKAKFITGEALDVVDPLSILYYMRSYSRTTSLNA